jgi:hypothetical protein
VLTSAPGGAQVQYWDPVNNDFITLNFSGPPTNRHWKNAADNSNADNTSVAPGTAFFISTGTDFTNTFVGSVVGTNGFATNSITSGEFIATSSLVPYGDTITNTTTLNLVPSGGSQIQLWDTVNQVFDLYSYSGPPSNRQWHDGNNNVVYPALSVGQGFFFYNASTPFTWTQIAP